MQPILVSCEAPFGAICKKKHWSSGGQTAPKRCFAWKDGCIHLVKAGAKNINLLQRKYVKASFKPKDWPQAVLHWPPMASRLSVLEHKNDVYQKKPEHWRICQRVFCCFEPCDLLWPWIDFQWSLLTSMPPRIITIASKLVMLHI